jgi:hypothetical protein
MKSCLCLLVLLVGVEVNRLCEVSQCVFLNFIGNASEGRKVEIMPVVISRKGLIPKHLSETIDVFK